LSAPAVAETTSQYASLIHSFNPKLAKHQTHTLAQEVIKDAQREHLDARLLIALVTVESRWRPTAVSASGARGLGQLMPHTAYLLGVDADNPHDNLRGTARYFGGLLREFGAQGQRLRMAIAAYNSGPAAVKRAGGLPSGTNEYVRRVVSVWQAIRARVGDARRVLPQMDTYIVIATRPTFVATFNQIVSIDDLPPQATQAVVTGP
jgi:soluble lytic murein transglycosylase-like protein